MKYEIYMFPDYFPENLFICIIYVLCIVLVFYIIMKKYARTSEILYYLFTNFTVYMCIEIYKVYTGEGVTFFKYTKLKIRSDASQSRYVSQMYYVQGCVRANKCIAIITKGKFYGFIKSSHTNIVTAFKRKHAHLRIPLLKRIT